MTVILIPSQLELLIMLAVLWLDNVSANVLATAVDIRCVAVLVGGDGESQLSESLRDRGLYCHIWALQRPFWPTVLRSEGF